MTNAICTTDLSRHQIYSYNSAELPSMFGVVGGKLGCHLL